MITVKELTKKYARNIAVDNISFEVRKGQIVGFLGPNGAGKTTTMRVLTCFLPPTSGSAAVAGFDVLEQPLEVKRRIGYLPESPPLYPEMATTEYLTFVGQLKGLSGADLRKRVDAVCERCAIADVKTKLLGRLSKGYRQRVGLAQALLGKPEVLLLDEPTAGLDPGQIQETREVIRSFGEHHAVLLSTHILPEVTLICRRVAIISQGRLLAIDSPSGLQRASEQTNRVTLTATAPAESLRSELLSLAGVTAVAIKEVPGNARMLNVECQTDARDGVEAAIARAVASRWDLHRLERQQPTLENIFLRYVSQSPAESSTPE